MVRIRLAGVIMYIVIGVTGGKRCSFHEVFMESRHYAQVRMQSMLLYMIIPERRKGCRLVDAASDILLTNERNKQTE